MLAALHAGSQANNAGTIPVGKHAKIGGAGRPPCLGEGSRQAQNIVREPALYARLHREFGVDDMGHLGF